MEDKNILHGIDLLASVPKDSLGLQLYKALVKNKESTTLVDGFTGQSRSNKDILNNSCRLGQCLRNYGLQRNDVIAISSENSLHYFDPALAALYSGIIVTTFNPHYTEGELRHAAGLSKPSIIFCSETTSAVVEKVRPHLKLPPKLVVIDTIENNIGCQSMQNFIKEHLSENFDINKFEPVDVNIVEQVAFVLYSSGTTGLPKGVMITHLNVNALRGIMFDGRFTSVDKTALGLMPFYHAYGLFLVFFRIMGGSKVIIIKKFDPEMYLKALQDYKIQHLHVVPPIAHFLAKSDLVDKYNLSSINSIVCGAAPLTKEIEEELAKRFKITNIRQAYGMTETTLGILGHQNALFRYGSCGVVLPNTSVKIVDTHTGKSLGPMKTGEICCRGASVMKGYLNDPEETRKAIDKDGWLHTGDVGYYDKDGLFYVVDRLKELIKYKGLQVAPAELEALLLSHPKIVDAAVIGIPDDVAGELPVAYAVKKPGENLTQKDVLNFIDSQVAPHKRLRGGVKFINEIPRNPSGKILRRLLRDKLKNEKSKL